MSTAAVARRRAVGLPRSGSGAECIAVCSLGKIYLNVRLRSAESLVQLHFASHHCPAMMSRCLSTRSAVLRAVRQTAQPIRVPSARPLSHWRQHDADMRAKKDAIRQHIRALQHSRRRFSVGGVQRHGHIDPPKPGEELHVTIIDKDGEQHEFEVAAGDNLLDIAQANDLEMEGEFLLGNQKLGTDIGAGACGGSCACSTCHVIVQDEDVYDKIPEADDDEVSFLARPGICKALTKDLE